MELEHGNKTRIENSKANKAGNIPHYGWFGPLLQQLVFGHCRPVAIWAHVNANEFHALREVVTSLQAEGKMLQMAHNKLAFNIPEGKIIILGPTPNVINNMSVLVSSSTTILTRLLASDFHAPSIS